MKRGLNNTVFSFLALEALEDVSESTTAAAAAAGAVAQSLCQKSIVLLTAVPDRDSLRLLQWSQSVYACCASPKVHIKIRYVVSNSLALVFRGEDAHSQLR